MVVGSDDGRLYVVAMADGRELGNYEIGQPITASPAVAGGWIVVGSEDGTVYAFGPWPAVMVPAPPAIPVLPGSGPGPARDEPEA